MSYQLLGVLGILTIVAVATLAPRIGVATPLLLVLIGTAGSLIPGVPQFHVPPEIILTAVLPPILYAAAVNVPLVDLRRNMKAITGLSVLLVLVSALVSGALFHWLLPELSIPAAIAIGAVISPTDAVAATSIAKRLGLPSRLVTVLEGESLANDASALVLLRSAVAATAGALTLVEVIGDFAYAVAAALVIGFLVGHATVWVRSRLNDAVLNTTISFAVPFLAFIPAEEIQASGVLAVVVAGLVTGHRSAKLFSAQDRISERINWRTIQFILENGVFLLMGFELKYLVDQVQDDHFSVTRAIQLGLLATVVLLAVRIAFIVPLIGLIRRDERRPSKRRKRIGAPQQPHEEGPTDQTGQRVRRKTQISRVRKQPEVDNRPSEQLGWRGGAVLAWSGMRGVVTLAAAQSLPAGIPYRAQLIFIAFTVAIASLLLQGGTLPALIRRLGIAASDTAANRTELASLVAEINAVGLATLDNPMLTQENGDAFNPDVIDRVRAEGTMRMESISELPNPAAVGPHAQHRSLRLRVLEAERAALLDARATGSYSSHVLERAQHLLDLEEFHLNAQSDG